MIVLHHHSVNLLIFFFTIEIVWCENAKITQGVNIYLYIPSYTILFETGRAEEKIDHNLNAYEVNVGLLDGKSCTCHDMYIVANSKS